MADVKFGIEQLKNPTPKWAKTIFRVALYATAGTTILLGIFSDEIPVDLRLKIMKYAVEGTAAIHAISRLIGIDISDINVDASKN